MHDSVTGNSNIEARAPGAYFNVLGAISLSHFLNDMIQSLILAIYPLLKGEFGLSFTQIGAITLTYQICASVLQPLVGLYTDRHPQPHALSVGMSFTLVGLLTLGLARDYGAILIAAALVGTGSAVFHPESSRIARLASGGRHGLAQSIFQVGGSAGSAMGPLLAAWVIIPQGRGSVAWFSAAAVLAILILWNVSGWYVRQHLESPHPAAARATSPLPHSRVASAVLVLVVLLFSKYFYLVSISSFYTFFLIGRFGISVTAAQGYLFLFLLASALGSLVGGPLGDAIGRKRVIWFSILGVAPFTVALPHVGLDATAALSFCIGFVLSSAFAAILVFAQELMPGKVGAVSGLFFGLAFGMGGIGAAVLGGLADRHGIVYVYRLCAYLPLLGVVAALLPDIERTAQRSGSSLEGKK